MPNDFTDGRLLVGVAILLFLVIWSDVLNPGKFRLRKLVPAPVRSLASLGEPRYTSWSDGGPAYRIVGEGRSVRDLHTDYFYRNVPPGERQRLLERLKAFEEQKRRAEEAKNRVVFSNNTSG
ncbi:MAG: hypothetical protein V1746_01850 [bacterium]